MIRPEKFLLVCVVVFVFVATGAFAQQPLGQQTQPTPPDPSPDLMLVHGRLKIEMPGEPLRLGEEAALPISSSGPPPSRVLVELNQAGPNGAAVPCGGGATPVEHRADGSTYVTITPQCIGKVEVRILASFTDGGLEWTHATAEVIAAKPPTALKVAARSMFNSVVRMDLSEESRQANLWLTASYPGVQNPLPIPAKEAQFKVTMTKGEPPIRFDPETGRIDALRIGQALIETSYGGLTQTTCVRVIEFAQGYSRDRCDAMQNGGDGVLPIADRADAPGGRDRFDAAVHCDGWAARTIPRG